MVESRPSVGAVLARAALPITSNTDMSAANGRPPDRIDGDAPCCRLP